MMKHAKFFLMELFKKPGNWLQICKQTSSTFLYIKRCVSLKPAEKKKLLGPHNKDISLKTKDLLEKRDLAPCEDPGSTIL